MLLVSSATTRKSNLVSRRMSLGLVGLKARGLGRSAPITSLARTRTRTRIAPYSDFDIAKKKCNNAYETAEHTDVRVDAGTNKQKMYIMLDVLRCTISQQRRSSLDADHYDQNYDRTTIRIVRDIDEINTIFFTTSTWECSISLISPSLAAASSSLFISLKSFSLFSPSRLRFLVCSLPMFRAHEQAHMR